MSEQQTENGTTYTASLKRFREDETAFRVALMSEQDACMIALAIRTGLGEVAIELNQLRRELKKGRGA